MTKKKKGYTGKTKNGRQITVWFSERSDDLFAAIAASDALSIGYYYNRRKQTWKPTMAQVDYDWTPTVKLLYKQFLDDIVAGE